MSTVAVVDYGMGNRRSVQKALERAGVNAPLTSDPDDLRAADGLVLPGVGAFPTAMRNLRELGLVDLLREHGHAGRPLLGICLGMQLLLDRSEELEPTEGLGLISGEVTRLDGGDLRIPHIGWNHVSFPRPSPITRGLPEAGCPFYHVHTYVARPRDRGEVLGVCEYGEAFASILGRGNLFGVQFHPEKSSEHGLRLLSSFLALCAPGRAHSDPAAAARA